LINALAQVMALEGKTAKALSRKGKAELFLKRYDKAKADLLAAAKLEVGTSSLYKRFNFLHYTAPKCGGT